MTKCQKCGVQIDSGEKIIVQFDGIMEYENDAPKPTQFGSLTKYWHKRCKPGY